MTNLIEWPGSTFPGLWTDRYDASDELDRRVHLGMIEAEDRHLYESFIALGFAVIPDAVPTALCQALSEEIHHAWKEGGSSFLSQSPGSQELIPVTSDLDPKSMRIVDAHVASHATREILFSSKITKFLREIFSEQPLLFQSLTFERGSEQGFHQDTAYVVVDEPRKLAAAWVALEDVRAGSGELRYIPRSHRIPEFLFSGEFKHWSPERDGHDQHDEWNNYLITTAQQMELAEERFLPKMGDVLIWAADLVHGGSPVEFNDFTRRSLVGHYCPNSSRPNYFEFAPQRSNVVEHGEGRFSSYHFQINPSPLSGG